MNELALHDLLFGIVIALTLGGALLFRSAPLTPRQMAEKVITGFLGAFLLMAFFILTLAGVNAYLHHRNGASGITASSSRLVSDPRG